METTTVVSSNRRAQFSVLNREAGFGLTTALWAGSAWVDLRARPEEPRGDSHLPSPCRQKPGGLNAEAGGQEGQEGIPGRGAGGQKGSIRQKREDPQRGRLWAGRRRVRRRRPAKQGLGPSGASCRGGSSSYKGGPLEATASHHPRASPPRQAKPLLRRTQTVGGQVISSPHLPPPLPRPLRSHSLLTPPSRRPPPRAGRRPPRWRQPGLSSSSSAHSSPSPRAQGRWRSEPGPQLSARGLPVPEALPQVRRTAIPATWPPGDPPAPPPRLTAAAKHAGGYFSRGL